MLSRCGWVAVTRKYRNLAPACQDGRAKDLPTRVSFPGRSRLRARDTRSATQDRWLPAPVTARWSPRTCLQGPPVETAMVDSPVDHRARSHSFAGTFDGSLPLAFDCRRAPPSARRSVTTPVAWPPQPTPSLVAAVPRRPGRKELHLTGFRQGAQRASRQIAHPIHGRGSEG